MRSILVLCALFLAATVVEGQIQPQFFAMGVASTTDMPKVSYGMLAHPPVGWTTIEGTGRGVYNFKSMDQFVRNAPQANGVAQIVIDLGGWTPGWAVANRTSCFHNKMGAVACTVAPDNIQHWVDYVTEVINQ